MRVTAYLDETGTHANSSRIMVGAAVTLDAPGLERAVDNRAEEVLASGALWKANPEKRSSFKERGFHHAEDDDTVRTRFEETLSQLDFRAHVCHSHRGLGLPGEDLLVLMYYTLVRNLLRRYVGLDLKIIYEENPTLNPLLGRLTEQATESLDRARQPRAAATAQIGSKPAGGLSVIDYVLAFTDHFLQHEETTHPGGKQSLPFQLARFHQIGPHMAHVIDFDAAAHRERLARLI